jgi:hypothetical protein
MKAILMFFAVAVAAVAPCNLDAASTFSLPSGVRVTIVEFPFGTDSFRVSGCGSDVQPCLINGRIPFGIAYGLPKTYVKSITVAYRNKSYLLNSSDMFNAWGNRPLAVKGAIRYFGGGCVDSKNCQFRGIFSDGAGTFVAEWRIVDGTEFRDILTDSSDVVDLFMHDIDPPQTE